MGFPESGHPPLGPVPRWANSMNRREITTGPSRPTATHDRPLSPLARSGVLGKAHRCPRGTQTRSGAVPARRNRSAVTRADRHPAGDRPDERMTERRLATTPFRSGPSGHSLNERPRDKETHQGVRSGQDSCAPGDGYIIYLGSCGGTRRGARMKDPARRGIRHQRHGSCGSSADGTRNSTSTGNEHGFQAHADDAAVPGDQEEHQNEILFFRHGRLLRDVLRGRARRPRRSWTSPSPRGRTTSPCAASPTTRRRATSPASSRPGNSVAICEQMETVPSSGTVVRRDVVRIITPGTVIEPNLLQSDDNNYLGSVHHRTGTASAWHSSTSPRAIFSSPPSRNRWTSSAARSRASIRARSSCTRARHPDDKASPSMSETGTSPCTGSTTGSTTATT